MAITFITFSAGDTTSHTNVNSNFGRINTYIAAGIPNTDLNNKYADVLIGPFTVLTLANNTAHHVIRVKPPSALVPVRAEISFDGSTGDVTLEVKEGGSDIMAILTATTVDTIVTRDSFTDASIAADSTLSLHIVCTNTGATVTGVTASLWCKSLHRE
tara:strand:+ start:8498 stop:8971 length:474 start_codon:yes stop_codon:yes gene_type:complete